jgi:hypothetical protein
MIGILFLSLGIIFFIWLVIAFAIKAGKSKNNKQVQNDNYGTQTLGMQLETTLLKATTKKQVYNPVLFIKFVT